MVKIRRLATAYPKRKVGREECRVAPDRNRAQVASRSGELVDDIVVRRSGRSVHVLNAVSPGLTCSLPFGAYLAEMCLSVQ